MQSLSNQNPNIMNTLNSMNPNSNMNTINTNQLVSSNYNKVKPERINNNAIYIPREVPDDEDVRKNINEQINFVSFIIK